MSYLPKLFSTGAIRKTPDRVITKIAEEVEIIEEETNIIEAGAGLGEITNVIQQNNTSGKKLNYYAFEIDEDSCHYLKENFPSITVLKESIFKFEDFIPPSQKLDYFISSIPLSFYKNDLITEFLQNVKLHLKDGGKIIILFTAAWLMPVLKKALPDAVSEGFLTFPPYFIIVYTHKAETNL
jgi:phospholipid N-methyltransferase